jgi:hypothetical protein
MADREKVIRGLECCITCDPDGSRECKKCPYRRKGITNEPCFNALHADALALLKEQEPRVMTKEEVIHSNDWIWYQWKNTHCGWAVAVNCDGKWIEWEDSTTDQLCEYGKKWRCWTARPTPEQMRDTKWEGENETM